MREVLYWKGARRLVYLHAKATPEFWDGHWESAGKPPPVSERHEVITVTRKYLSQGARVLEGGCGRADKVKAMADAGFRVTGVDFAEQSVQRARLDFPGLDVQLGDVRTLDFPAQHFDGYWSIGVIEHFWSGYLPILAEAARVLRPGGYLFLTAPWLSPYRQGRARAGGYPIEEFSNEPESFYQFALNRDEVRAALAQHGLHVVSWRGLASEVCMREDMPRLKRQVDWLLGSRGSILKRVFRHALTQALNGYCGHSFLAIARRV